MSYKSRAWRCGLESSGLDSILAGVFCDQWQQVASRLYLTSYRFVRDIVCQFRLCKDDDPVLKFDGLHAVLSAVSHNSMRTVYEVLVIDLTIFGGLGTAFRPFFMAWIAPSRIVLQYSVTTKCTNCNTRIVSPCCMLKEGHVTHLA